ncbi:hypothetical protein OHA88_03365 [Streptomyces sp. NBC_00353]|uniref:hypothetical protein n=1 Tax=Streptomyces sp. NBC_00353 TaxID=2975722 RepID=UPI002E273EA3
MIMQCEDAPGSGGHDVEGLLDELYATPPPDFVSRREELASEAKADGRVEGARQIRAARRPTLAAWAANLLLRSEPAESQRFLELGRALREAYRTLDADGIKELSDQRSSIVSALSRQAAALAREAGHRLSGTAQQDVVSTLRAVLADQDAADRWAAGRLESALTPPADFLAGTAAPAEAPQKPTRAPTAPRSSRTRVKDELQRQEQLAQARKAAAIADQQFRRQRAEQADADASLQHARNLHAQARQRVAAAEEQLRKVREEFQRAEHEQQEAEERCQASACAVTRTERAAQEAAQEVERLTSSVR